MKIILKEKRYNSHNYNSHDYFMNQILSFCFFLLKKILEYCVASRRYWCSRQTSIFFNATNLRYITHIYGASLHRFSCAWLVSRTVNTRAEEEETHAREDRIVGNLHWRSAGKRSHGHHRQEREKEKRKERKSRSGKDTGFEEKTTKSKELQGLDILITQIHSLLKRNKAISKKMTVLSYTKRKIYI